MKKYLLFLIFIGLSHANGMDKFQSLRLYDRYIKAGMYGGLMVASGVASCCLLGYSKNVSNYLQVPDWVVKGSSLLPLLPAGACLVGVLRECQLQRTSNRLAARISTPDSKYVR